MGFEEEIERIVELGQSREAVAAAGDLAVRALAAGDLSSGVHAKQLETQTARMLGMHNHVVVVTAETVELWPRIAALPTIAHDMQRRLVWTLKHGAGSAMDLPEIPLATVHELLGVLEAMLDRFEKGHQCFWELDARLAYIEGDEARMRDRVERVTPLLGMWSYISDYADCPACSLTSFVGFLGPDADADAVDAILQPILEKLPFPADAAHQSVIRLMYGGDAECENARVYGPIARARAYARAGRLTEAKVLAERATSLANPTSREMWLRAQAARLEVAVALADRVLAATTSDVLTTALPPVEDPYEQLEGVIALHRGARFLGRDGALPALRDQALALAARIDGRLGTPRHVSRTTRRLDATSAHSV